MIDPDFGEKSVAVEVAVELATTRVGLKKREDAEEG